MSVFKEWFIGDNNRQFKNKEEKQTSEIFGKLAWNAVLDKIKDYLAERMEVHYHVKEQNDIYYVRWHKIESLIDELKTNE